VITHDAIDGTGKTPAGPAPALNYRQAEGGRTSEPGRIEILVGDGVSPGIQAVEYLSPLIVTCRGNIHTRPEIGDTQFAEVATHRRLIRVAMIQLPVRQQLSFDRRAKVYGRGGGRGDHGNQAVHGLGVQVAAESLEVGRQ
jgi:hypothetical protein